jgi:hypothetical protein
MKLRDWLYPNWLRFPVNKERGDMKKYWKHSVKEGKTEFLQIPIRDGDHLREFMQGKLGDSNFMLVQYGKSKVYRGKGSSGPDVYVRADGREYSEKNSTTYTADARVGETSVFLNFHDKDGKEVKVTLKSKDNSKVVKIYILD